MTRKKLRRLRARLEDLKKQGGVRTSELERLAAALGRKQHPRGKEPTWVSTLVSDARPLTIPSHSRELNRFTAKGILNQLEGDVDALEEMLPEEEA